MRLPLAIAVVLAAGPAAPTLADGSARRSLAAAATSPATSVVATQPTADRIVVTDASGRTRELSVPPGCFPAATTATAVALGGCGPAILRLRGGGVRRLTLPSGLVGFAPSAIGAQWIEGTVQEEIDGGTRSRPSNAILNWHTNRLIVLDTRDPYGARRYPDLDASRPGRVLCRPVKRQRLRAGLALTRYGIVQRADRWFVVEGSRGSSLMRCGSSRTTRWGDTTVVRLGRRHLATYSPNRPERGVSLRSLRTGRTQRLGVSSSALELAAAFSSRELVISYRTSSGAWTIKSYRRFA